MANITKKELIDKIAQTHEICAHSAKVVVQAFLEEIINELTKGNRLEFRDFGVFEIRTREAREGQNPKTLEKVHVPAKRSVKFKMGRLMKQKLLPMMLAGWVNRTATRFWHVGPKSPMAGCVP